MQRVGLTSLWDSLSVGGCGSRGMAFEVLDL